MEKIDKNNLIGIVVWYNPTDKHLKSLSTYIHDLATLIVIDNSDNDNSALLAPFDRSKILYRPNYDNLGIATALNQGCKIAEEMGAAWVLTMDQDSAFKRNTVPQLVDAANAFEHFDEVGVFSPLQYGKEELDETTLKRPPYEAFKIVMTSGDLLNLSAYREVGRFRESYFIDLVDDELCYRLTRQGYRVISVNRIILDHFVGDSTLNFELLGKTHEFQLHNPTRNYYIARNLLYTIRDYPEHRKRLYRSLRKQFKRTLLYDKDRKWKKLRYIIRGYYDYFRGRSGKLLNPPR